MFPDVNNFYFYFAFVLFCSFFLSVVHVDRVIEKAWLQMALCLRNAVLLK